VKRIVIIGSVVVVLVIVGLSIGLTTRGNNRDMVTQKAEVVKRGDFVVKINSSGNLESLLSVEVKSNVEGEIEKLYVEDGDYVEAGQILLQIDDEQIREEMKQAEANVSASQAQLEQAKRSRVIKDKQLESDLQQQRDSVSQAQTSYNVAKATTLQQLSQQETDIQNTKESVEQDRIALRQAEISLKQAELTLSELEQSEAAAKVDLDNAESELKRNQELYEKKYVSKKSVEDAQASYANSVSRYESAQNRLLSQRETIKSQNESVDMRQRSVQMREATLKYEEQNLELLKQTRAAQEEQALTQLRIAERRLKQLEESIDDEKDINQFSLKSAEASLLRAQSTLNNQKERLGWTTIAAPMSGIVINLQIEEGEIVTSGRSAFSQSPPLMEIVDLAQMVVTTFINEVDMEKLALGQKAEIQLRAYPDKIYRGKVREISPSGQPRDNIIYFEVVIAVLGSPEELRPGMTADVDIIVVEHKNSLFLPIEAIQSDRAMTALLTVPAEDIARLILQQSVELEMGKNGKLPGTISSISSDNEGGKVEVTLDSTGQRLRPGRSVVNLIVDGNTIANVPAMLRFGKQYYVMLIPGGEAKDVGNNSDAQAVKKIIEVGEQSDMDIEILSGLREGDRVLVQAPTLPEGVAQFGGGRRRR
jgi:HlyD family secretion protein